MSTPKRRIVAAHARPIGPGKALIDMGFRAPPPRSELQRMLAAQGYTDAADLLPPNGCTIEEATAIIAAALDSKQRADLIAATKQRADTIAGYDRAWLMRLHRLGILHRVEQVRRAPSTSPRRTRAVDLGWCGRITLIGQLVGMLLAAE